jgi:hypothetical protein
MQLDSRNMPQKPLSQLPFLYVQSVFCPYSKSPLRIPATHKKFETAGVNIFHFEGNKIKEAWTVADGLTAALQLGVVKIESSSSR